MGWIIHKSLEIAIEEDIPAMKAFTQCCQREKEIVREEVAQSWPDYPLSDEEIPTIDMKNMVRAQRMIAHFEQRRKQLFAPEDKVFLETPFNVCLDEEHDVHYWGRIDVLIFKRSEDMIYNLDYKSTQPKYEYKEVPPQLLRYCTAYSLQEGIPMKRMKSVLFNLDSGNMPTRVWTSNEANSMIDYIVGAVLRIRATDPEEAPAKVGSHCRTLCQYSLSCPARALARKMGRDV